jgi:hypothetical protein
MTGLRKSNISSLLTAVICALLVAGAYTLYHRHNADKNADTKVDANTALVNNLSKAPGIAAKRSLASAYLAQGDYKAAEESQQQVARQTNDVNDWLGVLNICTVRAVPDKQSCVNEAVSKIKPHLDGLSFYSVYSAASELDQSVFKKDASTFYQRAYDIYDPASVDPYTKTKDQIKQRITELNG